MSDVSPATLMLASCQYPPDLLREIPAYRSLSRMRARLHALGRQNPSARRELWMAGDTIYVDPTAGLFDPEHPIDRYDAPYRFLKSNVWTRLLGELDSHFCLADDHEYEENWEPSARVQIQQELDKILIYGKRAHIRHFRPDLWPQSRPGSFAMTDGQVMEARLWGPRTCLNGIDCFVLDLRSEREHRDVHTIAHAKMVSGEQMAAFKCWLKACADKDKKRPGQPPMPKLVLSSSTLLPRRLSIAEVERADPGSSVNLGAALNSDACDGFPAFMGELFGAIAQLGVRGLLFLSGDEHLSFSTRAQIQRLDTASEAVTEPPITIHSIHASPLFGPYPFANGLAETFCDQETFCTLVPSRLSGVPSSVPAVSVTTSTQFYDVGDGFCELAFGATENPCDVTATFSGARKDSSVSICLA